MDRAGEWKRIIEAGAAPLIDLVYPPRCPACGEGTGEHGGLCASCWSDLAIPADPSCDLCQRPFGEHGPEAGGVCAPCMHIPPIHDGIAAGTLYTDTSRKLVLAFKHGRRIALAALMGRLMSARLSASSSDRLIVPVPLHRWRLWQRGYNQSALLARELSRTGSGTLLVDGLVRTRHTPSLGGRNAKQRAKVLAGAIEVRRPARIAGHDVILVDDVLTSGATTTACVRVLKAAGARSVIISCFARVLDEAVPLSRHAKRPGSAKTPGAT